MSTYCLATYSSTCPTLSYVLLTDYMEYKVQTTPGILVYHANQLPSPPPQNRETLLGYIVNLEMRSATNAIRFSGRGKIAQILTS